MRIGVSAWPDTRFNLLAGGPTSWTSGFIWAPPETRGIKGFKKIEPQLPPPQKQFKICDMKTHPIAPTFGCFDVELRVQWLEAKGDPLSRLDAVIDWEGFRPLLVQALAKPALGPGGRPAHDPVEMLQAAGGATLLQFVSAGVQKETGCGNKRRLGQRENLARTSDQRFSRG